MINPSKQWHSVQLCECTYYFLPVSTKYNKYITIVYIYNISLHICECQHSFHACAGLGNSEVEGGIV